MRSTAKSEAKRLEGVWEQFVDGTHVTYANTGGQIQVGVIHVPVAAPVTPLILYGMNIAVLLARSAETAKQQIPSPAVVAVTRLNARESVLGTVADRIQSPWGEDDAAANRRPWRSWLPIQLVGGLDSPWTAMPTRLPLKGDHRLDVGQRLAIILCAPVDAANAGTIIRMTAFGRYRVIHEQLA
jgi:hypothetical protein